MIPSTTSTCCALHTRLLQRSKTLKDAVPSHASRMLAEWCKACLSL